MRLLVIHIGGTIGMAQTPTGLAPKAGLVEDAVNSLATKARIDLQLLTPLIDSANATFADWNRIAGAISAAHDSHDGFVITHGTDTLAFTAAALCFALQGLRRPVILTGSMLPLGFPGSDGITNLTAAFATAQTAPAGVWVQFAGQLFHGARLRKAHSQARAAFTAAPALTAPLYPGLVFTPHIYPAPSLAILTVAPGLSSAAFAAALGHCDGAVLRVFGAGTIPNDPALARALRAAKDRGTPIIAVSQSPEGGIALGTYAAGNTLLQTGVIDGADMTPEAAYAKLAHVLGQPAHLRAQLLASILCGERS